VDKAKVEPKSVQGILRHIKIQTMLDLYATTSRAAEPPAVAGYAEAVSKFTKSITLCY
jgi:hypothetical protein